MRGKPRVEAGVKFVQGNFFAGETFLDLADARAKKAAWLGVANARVHGTTRQVPAVVFAAREAPCLLPAPAQRYQVPYWADVKVHVDYHIQVARALYSVPWRHVGARVMARADEHLVKVYLHDQLIKTHPRKAPGGRSTDAADMPPGVEGYATRTVDRIVAQAASYGPATGTYARRLLDGDAPWMMMRSVYRLIGLVKRYGPPAAEAACARALDVDVEHPEFGGDSILPRCSGLGGYCLPRYRRLTEPRSDHFSALLYRTSVQLRCPAARLIAGLCPARKPPGAWVSPRRAPRFTPRIPRAGQG